MLSGILAIFGAITGIAPAILQYLSLRANNAQSIALEELRIRAAKDNIALQVDLEHARADTEQQRRIYDFASGPSGSKFVDGLAVFVRPYITLILFHAWIALEVLLLLYGIANGATLVEMARILWNDEVQGMFSAIIGFWFGDRMRMRAGQQMAATVAVNNPQQTAHKVPPAGAPASGRGAGAAIGGTLGGRPDSGGGVG